MTLLTRDEYLWVLNGTEYLDLKTMADHDQAQRAVIGQLQEQLRLADIDQLNTESEVNAFHEERLQYNAKIEQQAKEIVELKTIIQACNKDGLADAVMRAVIENKTLREALQAMMDCLEKVHSELMSLEQDFS